MALSEIHEQTKRHQPEFILLKMHLADSVIEKPGKKLLVTYPTCVFFELSSLSILRLVPQYMASLYFVSSIGEVSSSISSAVSSSFLSSGDLRLCTKIS